MYMVRVYVDYCWVGDGTASSQLGQAQSNEPGYGAAQTPGPAPLGQTMRLQDAEFVPGGDAPTQANFNTAVVAAAASLNTLMATAGAYSGGPQTPLAIAQGWASGLP